MSLGSKITPALVQKMLQKPLLVWMLVVTAPVTFVVMAFAYTAFWIFDPEMLSYKIAILMPILSPVLVTPMIVLVFHTLIQALNNAQLRAQEFEALVTIDPLTLVATRRHFMNEANTAFARAKRFDSQLSIVMIDLDEFKLINDRYGHAVGDQVLQHVGQVCTLVLREVDVVGRIGGEEFAMLLLEVGADQAIAVAERLRQIISQAKLPIAQGEISYTASFGVDERQPSDASIKDIMSRADTYLYEAKRNGRNLVISNLTESNK